MSQDLPVVQEAASPPPEPATRPALPATRRGKILRMLLLLLPVAAFLLVFFIVAMTVLDYTESTPFCSLCHNMKPEATTHRNSAHARTDCGTCHVGPGAIPAIQAKLENARYVVVYPLGLYERPIPSPIKSLRPVEVVCEQCHWPQKFYEDRLRILPDYGKDESNSLTRTQLLLRTGGADPAGLGRGIHWHIDNPVYYIATDEKRQDIPWIQAQFQGITTEYLATDSNLTSDFIAKAEKRRVDCVDCHNRATHVFRNPDEALDDALSAGIIAADLPFIKREGMNVLDKSYGSEAEAAAAISGVVDFYRTNYPAVFAQREADVKAAVAGLQVIFDNTAFPFMNVTWQSHTDNIGHKDFAGCFRCHDGNHISQDSQVVRLECNICHNIPQVAPPGTRLPALQTTKAAEPGSHSSTSWLAQHRYQFDTTCAACHTIENPGGSDDSSFCSNSACHGRQWQFANLNAPKVRELSAPSRIPPSGAATAIPHPVTAKTDCLVCHGAGKVLAFPDHHRIFPADTCLKCHKPTVTDGGASVPAPQPSAAVAAGVPRIPHTLEGRSNCLTCHDLDKTKPFPANHQGRPVDLCQGCHRPR